MNEHYQIGDSLLTITALKFYLTLKDEKGQAQVKLIDWSDRNTHQITVLAQTTVFLGTDSLTNVSGILEGDLDPIHGMYWSWNSGYINFKLEGYWSNEPQQKFEYHIGGYRSPFSTFRKIGSLDASTTQLLIDLTPLFVDINENNLTSIMTPGKNAWLFAEKLINCYQLK